MEKSKLAIIIAAVATLVTLGGLGFSSDLLACLGLALTIVAFVIAGIGKAIGMVWNIAKWGLLVAPFPINFAIFASILVLELILFGVFSIIPVFLIARKGV